MKITPSVLGVLLLLLLRWGRCSGGRRPRLPQPPSRRAPATQPAAPMRRRRPPLVPTDDPLIKTLRVRADGHHRTSTCRRRSTTTPTSCCLHPAMAAGNQASIDMVVQHSGARQDRRRLQHAGVSEAPRRVEAEVRVSAGRAGSVEPVHAAQTDDSELSDSDARRLFIRRVARLRRRGANADQCVRRRRSVLGFCRGTRANETVVSSGRADEGAGEVRQGPLASVADRTARGTARSVAGASRRAVQDRRRRRVHEARRQRECDRAAEGRPWLFVRRRVVSAFVAAYEALDAKRRSTEAPPSSGPRGTAADRAAGRVATAIRSS